MSARRFASLVRREARGSVARLAFFTACLAVGVAAVVAVAGLSRGLDRAIRVEARKLLAADLVVKGRRPIPSSVAAAVESLPGAISTEVKELATVVAVPGAPASSRLVELKAVGPGYPFYGTVRTEPAGPLERLLTPDSVVVAPELLQALHVSVGDAIRIGTADFRIAGIVTDEPDRIAFSLTLGPRAFVSLEGLGRAGLEALGSRIDYATLVRMPDGADRPALERAHARLKAALPSGGWFDVESYDEGQPSLRSGLRRTARFLGLVALLSLLVGGIGVAQTVRAWLSSRLRTIAILRCVGMRPSEVTRLYAAQTGVLAAVGSAIGALAGLAVIAVVPAALPDLVPPGTVSIWQPSAVLRGVALGIGVALLFSVPELLALRRVSPVRVFRSDAEPLPRGRRSDAAAAALLLGGIFATAWLQSGSAAMGGLFTGGLVVVCGVLALAARGLTRVAAAAPRARAGLALRHGLAALGRPASGTSGAVVALGLGVVVVLGMWLVQRRLADELRADLPRDAPSAFLVDVQPAQLEGVTAVLAEQGATGVRSVPVVTARLRAVDGTPVEALARERDDQGRERWVLTREQRLTYLAELPADNVVVEGKLWSDPSAPEVSVERDFARDLGVRIGSQLAFDVQGVPVTLRVTSLRTVEWRTFGINFFLVVEPGVLEEAPQTRVAVARIPEDREAAARTQLAARYPNVTLLPIRDILEKVVRVLDRVGFAVRLLGGFTVAAGVLILGGAVAAGSVRRGRDVALLKALGATRRQIVAAFAVEYALIGLAAGAIGTVGAAVLAASALRRGMDLSPGIGAFPLVVATIASSLLATVAGIAASVRALDRRPVEVLRTTAE